MSQLIYRIFVEGDTDIKFLKDLIYTRFRVKTEDELFIKTSGYGSLYNEKNLNILRRVLDDGGVNIVIFDANGDFKERNKELREKAEINKVDIKLFLYPTNNEPGDRESLLQLIANVEKYLPFSICFDPYMECLKRYKIGYDADRSKDEKLDVPNRKVAIHNYLKIHRQEAKEKKRDYADVNYWDINSQHLIPLVDFLGPYFL